jgi:AcrR family transcriptional regulator
MRLGNVYSDNMISNANSVNIKSYHHGDLRSAAIAEGLTQLEKGSVDEVSLRAIARNIGVSATALYRHFPDKMALLKALAQHGIDRLGEEQRIALQSAGGGLDGFTAAGRTYVRFALRHPALFRLAMTCYPQPFAPDPDAADAMALLRSSIAELLPAGSSVDEQRAAVLQSWSMVHGLAMLMLDGMVPADDALIEATISPSYIHRNLQLDVRDKG